MARKARKLQRGTIFGRNWRKSRRGTPGRFRRWKHSASRRFLGVGDRRRRYTLTKEGSLTRSPEAAVKFSAPSNPLPGLNLTLGITVVYVTLIVLVPIGALALKALSLSFR